MGRPLLSVEPDVRPSPNHRSVRAEPRSVQRPEICSDWVFTLAYTKM